MIQQKYIKFFNAAEEASDYDVQSHIDIRATLYYLFRITGITLNKSAKQTLFQNINEFSFVQGLVYFPFIFIYLFRRYQED